METLAFFPKADKIFPNKTAYLCRRFSDGFYSENEEWENQTGEEIQKRKQKSNQKNNQKFQKRATRRATRTTRRKLRMRWILG